MSGDGPKTPDPFGGMMGQIGETWSATTGMWSAMLGTWQSLLAHRAAPAAQAVAKQMLTPGAWPQGLAPLFDELAQILAMPRFSDLPALDPKALPSLVPAAEMVAIANQCLLAALPLWAQACQRFQAEAAERRARDPAAFDSAGDALDVWNGVLDRTLMEFNRSPEFAGLQQRLLRAAMAQRQEARKFGEQMANAVDLPTRGEMDDVYRRLHDLLREVHELRREVRALKRARPASRAGANTKLALVDAAGGQA